jgi:hypothetical protein
MKLSRALAAGACSLLVVAAQAIAAADVDSGTWTGKVKRGGTVRFKVTSSTKLAKFGFSGVRLKCSDGDRPKLPRLATGPDDRMTIADDGRFAFTARYDGGAKWTASGTIAGGSAKGKIRVTMRFNRAGEVVRRGSIRCSVSRRFTARHG